MLENRLVPIPGMEKYLINESGEIFSLKSNRFLKPRVHSQGYLRIHVSCRDHYVHRLVAQTFIGKSNLQINHKNGIKTDNRLANLEYVTCKENMEHGWENGLYSNRGENHHLTKLTGKIVLAIYNDGDKNFSAISRKFNVPVRTVHNIKRGISWKHLTGAK